MFRDKLSFAIFLLISLNWIQCQEVAGTSRTVSTSVGDIQGDLDSDGGYYKFLGIPYGQVSKENPLGDSTEFPPFEDVFEANNDAVICPQNSRGSLDCLNLHVYVPATATAISKLPVIIWIHGGRFIIGSGSEYGPKYLVRHDVIVVTINYRMGLYGFMCLGIPEVPGNQGLKDQHLAFEWVHRHIESFGGNPDQITLAGQSAGAHSVDMHLLSQRDKVYNQVIIQSGSSLAGTMLSEPDRAAALKIAERLGLTTNSSREAVAFLGTQEDPLSIMRAASGLGIQYSPCVETEFEGGNPFLSKSWINAPVEKIRNVSVMIGFTEFERMSHHVNQDSQYFENLSVIRDRLNADYDFNDSSIADDDRLGRMEDLVRRFYAGDSTASEDLVWPVINFDSDFVFIHPIQRSIKKFLAAGAGDIFYYMFTYSGGRNHHLDRNNVTIEGAAHNDDLAYLFELASLSEEPSPADQLLIDRMSTMWTNFAKYGNPTPETTQLLPVKWTPLTSETFHYLKIDSELTLEQRPLNKRMAFHDLFYMHNIDYQRSYDDNYSEDTNGSYFGSGTINPASLITLLSALLVLAFLKQ